ncbi:MAG: hypothetical protein EZS28_020017 [Streblomastix strix]|uniref:Uncharacterized protein n=1 Tax=Streblomastix strix TaxID=222440 RepID=A0A5J4VP98_9EUKA|nr:MAG: hypothetical protein EZS28_020017 [Streblomastix strix]
MFQSAVLHIYNEPSGLLIIVHQLAISQLVLVGEVPIQIAQRLQKDAFAILNPSPYDTVVRFNQILPKAMSQNVFLPLIVQSVPTLTNSLSLNFIIELSLLIDSPTRWSAYLQVRPVGLTYSILLIIPPLAKSQVIGIYVPFDTLETTSYVNISVILLVQQVLQSDTTIVMAPADSNLTYAAQTADVPMPE